MGRESILRATAATTIMTKELTKIQLELDAARVTSLRDAANLRLGCVAGLIWVTVEGDVEDHWLAPGEALDIRGPGNVVIEAQRASQITLTPTPRARPRQCAPREHALRRQLGELIRELKRARPASSVEA